MITNSDIIEIFRAYVPTDRLIVVRQIHIIVNDNWKLSEEDRAPHPSEVYRGSNYPSWKRKVQAVLHTLKQRNKIQHLADTHEYIFDSSSFD